ncbi:MAG: ABC transporter ATP-binding protein [Oscillospiraceae bacterium]|nr:ABC transporter ATP-binding protein [Oscillospiraceae bacterium]
MTNRKKLQILNLEKAYKDKCALDNVSFDVIDGEFLSILGPSGCGKTTLLRIITGLISPDSGRIIKDGTDITKAPPSCRGMGIVFQSYALFENMTVLGNVEYALKIKRATRKHARQKATDIVDQLGLTEHISKKPYELSGGQQQRVAIARTLVLNPDIILFDEPMSALDVSTRLMLRKELKAIQAEFGTTMIYITHDQEEAFALSDRIMVMDEARIVQLDTPDNIIRSPKNNYVRTFVIDNLQAKIDSLANYTVLPLNSGQDL